MTPGDLSAVMDIENNNHPYPWSKQIMSDCFKENYISYVYILDGEIIGYLVQTFAADESNILNVCVESRFRSNGFADQLMHKAINCCREMKNSSIFLEVRASNAPAINLYHKHGFVEVGVRKGYYPTEQGREDAIVMALEILALHP
mgnify:CR=1 FL=1